MQRRECWKIKAVCIWLYVPDNYISSVFTRTPARQCEHKKHRDMWIMSMEEKHETLTLHLAGCSQVPSLLKPSKNVKCSIVFGEVKKMCFNSDPHVARNMNNTPLKALPMQRRDDIDWCTMVSHTIWQKTINQLLHYISCACVDSHKKSEKKYLSKVASLRK